MANQVRIIGGHWRGKRINVPEGDTIRPTGDRIRETLFNWIGMRVHQAHCLDLFAGSGILGLEALSRGAKQVSFIDYDASVIKHLENTIMNIPVAQRPKLFVNYHLRFPLHLVDNPTLTEQVESSVHLIGQDALSPIKPEIGSYDIIFLDPPFNEGLLEKCFPLLKQYGYEKSGTLIYMEMEATLNPILPDHWRIIKQGKASRVVYLLVEVLA